MSWCVAQTIRVSDRDRPAPADALDHALLEEAQQLDLERQRHVADLVEEQRAAAGQLDLALGGLDRAGEGALLVPEQLAFEQGLGIAAQLIATKAPFAPALVVQLPRASSSLPVPLAPSSITETSAPGDALDRAGDLEHLGAPVSMPAQHRAGLDPLGEAAVLGLQRMDMEGAGDDQAERVDVDRLRIEVPSARRRSPRSIDLARTVARGDDHLGIGPERQDRLPAWRSLRSRAVGIGRQAEVERHDRRLLGAHCTASASARGAIAVKIS